MPPGASAGSEGVSVFDINKTISVLRDLSHGTDSIDPADVFRHLKRVCDSSKEDHMERFKDHFKGEILDGAFIYDGHVISQDEKGYTLGGQCTGASFEDALQYLAAPSFVQRALMHTVRPFHKAGNGLHLPVKDGLLLQFYDGLKTTASWGGFSVQLEPLTGPASLERILDKTDMLLNHFRSTAKRSHEIPVAKTHKTPDPTPYGVTQGLFFGQLRVLQTRPIPASLHPFDCRLPCCTPYEDHSESITTRAEDYYQGRPQHGCWSGARTPVPNTVRIFLKYYDDCVRLRWFDDDDGAYEWGLPMADYDWLIDHFNQMGVFEHHRMRDWLNDFVSHAGGHRET